ncbi:hypothetical protein QR680_006267 [Steinernema hermaphroditum]|uniref:Cation-transporting P-type ATPase N-terminal domain-containing protein n=1 Tax=Steinernema hermaphroditum TaxID=289476 RepID=A0AA39HWB8_9BILA|nr:hypothetical protein QR680_006267 [Steinernema hermaphroditum]
MGKKRLKSVEAPEDEAANSRNLAISFTEHHLDVKQLATLFPKSRILVDSPKDSLGLSEKNAKIRFESDGPNRIEPPKDVSDLVLLGKQFLNVFWILQAGAGVLSIVTYIMDTTVILNLYVAIMLFGIVIIMCFVQFFEEKKTLAVIRAFSQLLPPQCTVIRDGKQLNLDAEQLVVGDVVIVKTGNRVPADLRIIHSCDLKLETSSITGESEPIEYTTEPANPSVDVFDSCNVGFNGSFCVDGEGVGVVIKTGDKTVIGQIASLTTDQSRRKSTLDIEVQRFVKIITIAALALGTIVFTVGVIMTDFKDITETFMNGFLVAIISTMPQGLPTTVSSELTIIAHRMAKKNVYMKKLDVVDAFGATTVVASDKTGTLTQNNMKVTDLWYGKRYLSGIPEISRKTLHTLKSLKSDIAQDLYLEHLDAPLPDLLEIMAVCNKGNVEYRGAFRRTRERKLSTAASQPKRSQDTWKPSASYKAQPPLLDGSTEKQVRRSTTVEKRFSGSPSEVALLKYVDSVCSILDIRSRYDVAFEVPFNSQRKFHIMILNERNSIDDPFDENVTYTLMIKGAPEVVITKCNGLATADGEEYIDDETMMDFQDAYDHFGNNGRRVIGFAKRTFIAPAGFKFSYEELNFPLHNLTFYGISAIMDPPRPDTAEAIRQCKEAGIKVFMVTGDHPSTAQAIAKEIGLIGEPERLLLGRHTLRVTKIEEEDASEGKDWAAVHGSDLSAMTENDWDELLKKRFIVFARTTPEHKLMIVENCQKRGEIVTVTGDGVNDAPALKRANIGVAMGLTGSDVAKQAADVVLMDDKFASIIHGIEEGRLLFDNLRKSIGYTLSHCFPSIVPMLLNFIGGLPPPMSALQMLSIDLGTDLPPAISLAYEPPESDIMKLPPRKRTTRLVSFAMLTYAYQIAAYMICTGSVSAYFYVYWRNGINPFDIFFTSQKYFRSDAIGNFTSWGNTFTPPEQVDIRYQAAAACYIVTVTSQVYHIWMCKTRRTSIFTHGVFRNGATVLAVLVELGLLCLLVYTPGVKFVMGSSSPPFEVWFFSLGVAALLLLPYNETRKFFIRRAPHNPIVRLVKW